LICISENKACKMQNILISFFCLLIVWNFFHDSNPWNFLATEI
jgi:hypothetical protein